MLYKLAALSGLLLTSQFAQATIFLDQATLSNNCTEYDVSTSNCATSNCGQCYNLGSRPGVICPGYKQTSTGYYCPTEQGPAFACMDWTFGSTAMKAAEDKFNAANGDSVYFGVGTYGSGDDPIKGLGACYRLKIDGMDRDLLVQSINTGGDVSGNQFDLQIGDGGAGIYNSCAGSSWSMFPGGTDVWGNKYGGVDHRSQCANLPHFPQTPGPMQAAGDDLARLCEYSFDKNTRIEGGMNPSILDVSRVKCPEGILDLTQLQRTDEPASYQIEAAHRPSGFAPGSKCAGGGSYCLTRMMDCRKPSGAWHENLSGDLTVAGRKVVQPCTQDGYTRIDVQCGCGDCWC
jgi:hypothetical protein